MNDFSNRKQPTRDQAIEAWLRDCVLPAARALEADPTQAISLEDARKYLAKRRAERCPAVRNPNW
ncbi:MULTISPECIES: hypothetical protein [Stenotrophomonas]|jgi:hypothetical protein|uniref:Addiction module protein n=1 Tax=Stenotrophomonas aracearum TaxID=3003272 RepID=A0ABY9YDI2_9GAMM|nr:MULTISPECIES: hypothetical protein [unclassified Stenotrophomonas]WNH48943.1 hypothetical protein PDM28_01000 [Stenotrophomonas sp. A5588]